MYENDDYDNKGIFENDYSDNENNLTFNLYSLYCHNITSAQRLNLTNSSLIIHSASSVNIIDDENMVYNIHDAPHPLTVCTVNGSSTISKKVYLGKYPLPV